MKKTSTLARFWLFGMSLYKFLDVIGEQQAPVVFDLNHLPIPPLDGKQLPDLLGWKAITNKLRWIATYYRIGWNILRNHTPSGDNRSIADGYT